MFIRTSYASVMNAVALHMGVGEGVREGGRKREEERERGRERLARERKKERASERLADALNFRHSGMTCALLLSRSLFPSLIKPRFLSLSFSIAASCSPFLLLARSLSRSLAFFRSLSVSFSSHNTPFSLFLHPNCWQIF